MPEFIFKKKTLLDKGSINFDMAWRSDTASVMNIAQETGIATIASHNSKVEWRSSGSNLSSYNIQIERKTLATVEFFNWFDKYLINY